MSDIVTTDTEDAAADADKPRDDTDVLFRDDVDDADDLPTPRLTAHRHCVDCRVRRARDRGCRLRCRHPDGEAQRACDERSGR